MAVIADGDGSAVLDGSLGAGIHLNREGHHAAHAGLHIGEGPGHGMGQSIIHTVVVRGQEGGTVGKDIHDLDLRCHSAGIIMEFDRVLQDVPYLDRSAGRIALDDHLFALGRIVGGIGIVRRLIVQLYGSGVLDSGRNHRIIQRRFGDSDLEGNSHFRTCGHIVQGPGDGAIGVDAAVGNGHQLRAGRNLVGDGDGTGFRAVILGGDLVLQLITHHDRSSVRIGNVLSQVLDRLSGLGGIAH